MALAASALREADSSCLESVRGRERSWGGLERSAPLPSRPRDSEWPGLGRLARRNAALAPGSASGSSGLRGGGAPARRRVSALTENHLRELAVLQGGVCFTGMAIGPPVCSARALPCVNKTEFV